MISFRFFSILHSALDHDAGDAADLSVSAAHKVSHTAVDCGSPIEQLLPRLFNRLGLLDVPLRLRVLLEARRFVTGFALSDRKYSFALYSFPICLGLLSEPSKFLAPFASWLLAFFDPALPRVTSADPVVADMLVKLEEANKSITTNAVRRNSTIDELHLDSMKPELQQLAALSFLGDFSFSNASCAIFA